MMTRRLCALLMPLMLVLLAGLPASAEAATRSASACRGADATPNGRNAARLRAATLCLVNRERTKRGRAKLRRNRKLERVAERYAERMVDEGFFAHVSPEGSTLTQRISRTSYLGGSLKSWSLGENIAWGKGRSGSPRRIVAGWMASSGHRSNVLNRQFREAGFGVVAGAPGTVVRGGATTYTNTFGRRVRR